MHRLNMHNLLAGTAPFSKKRHVIVADVCLHRLHVLHWGTCTPLSIDTTAKPVLQAKLDASIVITFVAILIICEGGLVV